MRRRNFIKGIGSVAAGWGMSARGWLGVTGLHVQSTFIGALPASAQRSANLPIEIAPNLGHTASLSAVAFSPDGRTVVSASHDKTLKLWDAATGHELRTLRGHEEEVDAVAFLPDGRTVVSGSRDCTVRLWDAVSGRELRTLIKDVTHADRYGWTSTATIVFAVPRDGHVIVSGSNETVRVWDPVTGRELRALTGHTRSIEQVACSADGRTIASVSGDKMVRVWDASSGRALRAFAGVRPFLISPDGRVVASASSENTLKLWDVGSGRELRTLAGIPVAFSPNGRVIVSKLSDNSLKLWDASSGSELRALPGGHPVAFAPDVRTIVLGSADETILKLWDTASGRERRSLTGHRKNVVAVQFSPDGRTIASASSDATLKLWDAGSGRELRTLAGNSSAVDYVKFSPNGRTIFSTSDGILKLWDAATGRELRRLVGPSYALALSPDSSIIAWGSDRRIRLWDVTTGRELRTLTGNGADVLALTFSPDGRTIVSAAYDDTLKSWDVSSGRELRTFAGRGDGIKTTWGQLNVVAFSPDGRSIVSGNHDNTIVKRWDAVTGRELGTLPMRGIDAAAFSSDGRTFVAAADSVVRLWDTATWRDRLTFSTDAPVALSPDGRLMVSTGPDYSLKLWDAETGRELRTFTGHRAAVSSVAFSPDGRTIVSGSDDTTMRRWSVVGELLTTSIATPSGEWLTMTPEGFFDGSDNGAQLLGAVRGLETYSIDQFYQQLYRPDVVRQKLSSDPEINRRVKYAADNVSLEKILDSKAPPEIAIASPENASEVGDTSIVVEVNLSDRASDKGGGIGRIEWRVNDVTRVVQDLQQTADGKVTTLSQTLALPDGTSEIKVVAYNKANLAASLPAVVSVTVKSSAPRPQPKLYVFAIGVDRYPKPQIDDLKYSVADARSVLAAFELFKSDRTIYADVIGRGLFNEQVTRQNVQAELKRLGGIIRPDDVFVLYLAGHGVTEDGRFYFVPHDAKGTLNDLKLESAIGQNQLQEWLTDIHAFRSVLMYDSCESGSVTEDRSGFRGLQQRVAAEKLSRSMGRTVLSATTDVTAALEGYEKQHGFFTYVLLDAFAYADRDNDGRITTEELAEYLRTKLPQMTEDLAKRYPILKLPRQEPQVKLSGAPFALVPRTDIADINRVR